jgi:hypothetical protein
MPTTFLQPAVRSLPNRLPIARSTKPPPAVGRHLRCLVNYRGIDIFVLDRATMEHIHDMAIALPFELIVFLKILGEPTPYDSRSDKPVAHREDTRNLIRTTASRSLSCWGHLCISPVQGGHGFCVVSVRTRSCCHRNGDRIFYPDSRLSSNFLLFGHHHFNEPTCNRVELSGRHTGWNDPWHDYRRLAERDVRSLRH